MIVTKRLELLTLDELRTLAALGHGAAQTFLEDLGLAN